MNATVLDKADIGEGAIIAAGAVVTHGTKVPAHEIWAGIPAKKVKTCAPGQAEEFAKHYSGYIKDWYLKEDRKVSWQGDHHRISRLTTCSKSCMMKMIRDRKTKMRPHNTDAFLFL